jgi:hypothetical protein
MTIKTPSSGKKKKQKEKLAEIDVSNGGHL